MIDPPLDNGQKAELALSYSRQVRRHYDAVDSAFVAAIHNNTAGAYAEVQTDAGRPVLVVLAFGEEEVERLKDTLKSLYSTQGGEQIQPKPVPCPVAVPLRKKAEKKDG